MLKCKNLDEEKWIFSKIFCKFYPIWRNSFWSYEKSILLGFGAVTYFYASNTEGKNLGHHLPPEAKFAQVRSQSTEILVPCGTNDSNTSLNVFDSNKKIACSSNGVTKQDVGHKFWSRSCYQHSCCFTVTECAAPFQILLQNSRRLENRKFRLYVEWKSCCYTKTRELSLSYRRWPVVIFGVLCDFN